MALALRTKPHTNSWLCLSQRVGTLGEDAFEHAPAVIKEIHAYLRNLFNERELAGGMMLQLLRNLIASFIKDIRKLSIGLVLAMYVTFGHENFVKGPANLFAQALANLRLDGNLTLIAMTYGRLGHLFVLLHYPEQSQGASRELNAQLKTTS